MTVDGKYGISSSPDVQIGKDGWLFLIGGNNDVLSFYQDPDYFPDQLADQWVSLLAARQTKLMDLGIAYRHIVAPEKLTVFPDLAGIDLLKTDIAPSFKLSRIYAYKDDTFINPTRLLRIGNGILPSYFKTDTHWTPWGAYLAFMQICWSMQIENEFYLDQASFKQWIETFDLGSKVSPNISEKQMYMPFSPHVNRVYANEVVQLREAPQTEQHAPSHHGAHTVFYNNLAKFDKKVFIFGDSFSGYGESMLTAMFVENYTNVHFFWSENIDFNYIQKDRPDIVISELAERFMRRVPSDKQGFEEVVEENIKIFLEKNAKSESNNIFISNSEEKSQKSLFTDNTIYEKIKQMDLVENDKIGSSIFCIDFTESGNSELFETLLIDYQEIGHRWCLESYSEILVKNVNEEILCGQFIFEINFDLFKNNSKNQGHYLRICLNDYVVFAQDVYSAGRITCLVNMPPFSTDEELKISLFHPDHASPHDISGGDDGRQLSIALKKIAFRRIEER